MYRADGPDEMRRSARSSSSRGWPRRAPAGSTARSGGRRDRRPRQPESGRAGRAGAGSVAGGQPEPLPRHPPFGDLGPASRGGEHGRARQRASLAATSSARARGCWRGWASRWKGGSTSRSCRSWRSSRKAVPDLPIILNHIGGLLRTGPYAEPRRRGDADLAQRHRRGGGLPQRLRQARRHRHAAHRLRLARRARSRSARRSWRRRWRRCMSYCIEQFGPERVHVREQLPGGQGLVLVQRAVQRLQAALVEGLLGRPSAPRCSTTPRLASTGSPNNRRGYRRADAHPQQRLSI